MSINWQTVPGWDGREQNVHILARGELALEPGEWELRISAYDHYDLWLDGQYLGQGPVPSYHPCFDSYIVRGGERRTVSIHLYVQGLNNRVWCSAEGRLGLYLSVHQGNRTLFPPPLRYFRCRAYSGGTVGYDTAFLEDFDSRLWPEGWESPGYPDEDWQKLTLTEGVEPKPRPIAKLWEEGVEPVCVRAVPGGFLLDYGRELAGRLTASAAGREGDTVTLRFAEELDEDGRAGFSMRCGCQYEEKWILARGKSVYHPCEYQAFRYVEILHDPGVRVQSVQVTQRHYPMGHARLTCGKDQVGEIFEICKNAVRCCTQEGFLDCATREKGQYLGDAIITARSQVWLTGKTDMLRKCIRDFIASQSRFAGILAVAPCTLEQRIADFSLLFPLLPLLDYQFTGDKAFLRECYLAAALMVAYFGKYQRPDGLLENVGDLWNLVDWPESARDGYDFPLTRPVVAMGCHNVVNALWYGANRMLERMASILCLPVQPASGKIAEAFLNCFFRRESKLFADSENSSHCSLHANLYPAFFGLLPRSSVEAFEQLLLTPGRFCGVFPMYFALEGLARLGKKETLYRLLTRTDEYGWRNMLRQGATACFEAWGKEQKWNTSLCHPWASSPIPLIIEHLVGLHPDPAAADGFRFEPGDLLTDFELILPWRDGTVTVNRTGDNPPVIERSLNALS